MDVFNWNMIIAGFLLLWAYTYIKFKAFGTNQHPSFYGLPLLGTLPLVLPRKLRYLSHTLTMKYFPPVFRVYIPFVGNTVIATSPEALRDILYNDAFTGKFSVSALDMFFDYFIDTTLLLLESGDWWYDQRKFMFSSFNQLGFGSRSIMEAKVKEEVIEYLREIRTHNGAPLNIRKWLAISLANNITNLVVGRRTSLYNEIMAVLVQAPGRSFLYAEVLLLWLGVLPRKLLDILSKWGLIPTSIHDFYRLGKKFRAFMDEYWEFRLKNFNPDDVTDYVDQMIQRSLQDPDRYTVATCRSHIVSITTGGAHTLTVTIENLYQYCAAYPWYQAKVFEEICEIIGTDRLPVIGDLERMHFTKAFIAERHRCLAIGPYSANRSNTEEDTTILGKHVPRGSLIAFSVEACHMSPEIWDRPEEFRPERYLDENGVYVKSANLFMFSAGKRVCPGEALAGLETFFYFVSVVQSFKILPASTDQKVILARNEGVLVARPFHQELRFVKRPEVDIRLPEGNVSPVAPEADQASHLMKKHFGDFRWTLDL